MTAFTGLAALAATRDLPAFAIANGLRYDASAEPPASGGSLWEALTSGIVTDRVTGATWETGNIEGGTRSSTSEQTLFGMKVQVTTSVTTTAPGNVRIGYLAVTLARRLPNMILDAQGNDPLFGSSLPRPPQATQRLSLEGDFDRHFSLYVPSGYERDALYVFTPDLMALLIDETGDLDVEIRDDRLLVYARGGFDLRDPALWPRIERIMRIVGAKTFSQTDLYADERIGDRAANVVAPEGQRLRRRLLGGRGLVAALAIVGFVVVLFLVIGITIAVNVLGPLLR